MAHLRPSTLWNEKPHKKQKSVEKEQSKQTKSQKEKTVSKKQKETVLVAPIPIRGKKQVSALIQSFQKSKK